MKKRMKDLKKVEFDNLEQLAEIIKKGSGVKFIESIDLDIKLNINPKKVDENIRSSFEIPHGVKKNLKVVVFTENKDDVASAIKSGAYKAGGIELVEQIKENKSIDADLCICSIESFKLLQPIAKILGPSGLMPNKKDGTVTDDIIKSVDSLLGGTVRFVKNDHVGHVRLNIGKCSMKSTEIIENIKYSINTIKTYKLPKIKQFINSVSICSTMGLSYKIPLKLL